MKKLRLEFKHWLAMFLFLLVGTTTAGAFELKVNDGGDHDGRLPVYGIYVGAYQRCEFVMASELLPGMTGVKINKLTFYVQDGAQRTYIGNCKVFMKEVPFKEFTTKTYAGIEDATVVYEGRLDATSETMEVALTTPYEYKGGNLLIGMYVTEKSGSGGSVRFFGKKTNQHTGLSSYSYDSFKEVDDDLSKVYVNFLPTMTFDCENAPHAIAYNSHDGKVIMAFDGCEEGNIAKIGSEITATATIEAGYALKNIRAEEDVTITDNGDKTYSFTMPDHSVFIESDLLRDISYMVDVTEPLRFATDEDIRFELTDVIDPDNKVVLTKDEHYTVTFDKEPTAPGKYVATFTGIEENGYTGSFTKEFTYQNRHKVKLLAGYFGTYFYDTAIETFDDPQNEDDDIILATVTAVAADGKASITKLTESKVAKKYPFLIYNPYDTEKEFELWEAIEDVTPANPTPATQFTGTADARPFSKEETDAKDYYVLQNGKEFVYVMFDKNDADKNTKPAHRCWIELPKASGARILTIAIDEATGISEVKAAQIVDGIYDMQGRRLTGKPSQRGMYVIDGKKVVVK